MGRLSPVPNITRREFLKQIALIAGAALLSACKIKSPQSSEETIVTPEAQSAPYLEPVYATSFKVESTFWSPRVKRIIQNWIPHCFNKLSDPYLAEGGMDNFIQAALKLGGKPAKSHVGYWFSNAYVLNTVEAMCNALIIDPQGDANIINAQNAMRAKLDD